MKRILTLSLFLFPLLSGCGGGTEPASTPNGSTQTTPSASATASTSGSTTAPATPADSAPTPKADPYEMDPAKHVVPATPVAGKLGGRTFTPDRVEIQDDRLTFRQGTEFLPDLEWTLTLSAENKANDKALSIQVKPEAKEVLEIPMMSTSLRQKDSEEFPKPEFYQSGYALTLKLGPLADGKRPGKIVVCLPDKEKSYLAGTFEAEVVRAMTVPPAKQDAPFIQGTITAKADTKEKFLTIGYVGIQGDATITDRVSSAPPKDPNGGGAVQSSTFKPRVATLRFVKGVPNYDFSKLPVGRYFVYARLEDGPTTWKWVEVKADSQITENFVLDGSTSGTVEVTTPADFKGRVQLAPEDSGVPDKDHLIAGNISFALELEAEAKNGTAVISNVPAGKYQIFTTPGKVEPRGTVEVTAGKTAKTELK